MKNAFRKRNKTSGMRINDRNGVLTTDQEDIIRVWTDLYSQLYD